MAKFLFLQGWYKNLDRYTDTSYEIVCPFLPMQHLTIRELDLGRQGLPRSYEETDEATQKQSDDPIRQSNTFDCGEAVAK